MVGRWGMSELVGPFVAIPSDNDAALIPGGQVFARETQRLVDEEARRIVTAAHEHVLELQKRHRDKLDALTPAPTRCRTYCTCRPQLSSPIALCDVAREDASEVL